MNHFLKLSNDSVWLEEDGDGNMGTVYIILVFAIVALALVLIVKPMFQQAQKVIPKTPTTAAK